VEGQQSALAQPFQKNLTTTITNFIRRFFGTLFKVPKIFIVKFYEADKPNCGGAKVLQTKDKHILKAMNCYLTGKMKVSILTVAQKRELDERLEEIENGKGKFYTINEVKKIVRKKLKSKLDSSDF
jgi:hypothetical protein